LTLKQLVKEVRAEAKVADTHGVTLLVNPRKGSDRIEAGAVYSAADFLRGLSAPGKQR